MGANVVHGQLGGATSGCRKNVVEVFRVMSGPDKKIAEDVTDASGFYSIVAEIKPNSQYYAVASEKATAGATCAKAKSQTVFK